MLSKFRRVQHYAQLGLRIPTRLGTRCHQIDDVYVQSAECAGAVPTKRRQEFHVRTENITLGRCVNQPEGVLQGPDGLFLTSRPLLVDSSHPMDKNWPAHANGRHKVHTYVGMFGFKLFV